MTQEPDALNAEKITPMMKQYREIKNKYPEHLLLFRLGDFYEMFFEDAVTASRELGLTLTTRNRGADGENIPLAGVPHHAVDSYLAKLIRGGFKVAICDQLEDPKLAKGIVKRGVTRLVSAGTLINETLLEDKVNNYLLALNPRQERVGLAFIDLSTGEFGVTDCFSPELADELTRLSPAECLIPESLKKSPFEINLRRCYDGPIAYYPDWAFEQKSAELKLTGHFKTDSLRGFGIDGKTPCVGAAGAALRYLEETHLNSITHIAKISLVSSKKFLMLDKASVRNLELVRAAFTGDEGRSLLGVLDRTATAMGGRLLRQWLVRPLAEAAPIRYRQSAVSTLMTDSSLLDKVTAHLKQIGDLERLVARICTNRANARDLVSLKDSLKSIPGLRFLLANIRDNRLAEIRDGLDPLENLADALDKTIVDEPPLAIMEGGMIRDGVHRELDQLRQITHGGKKWMSEFQTSEIARTGISSLKIGFNKVFGYYIEITHVHKDKVPANYIRKQTLVNAERYITPELKEYEDTVLNSEERMRTMEYEIFCKMREAAAREFRAIQQNAALLAELDVLACFAVIALKHNYILPTITEDDTLRILDGRHPVVEEALPPGKFVPNDTLLDCKENQIIILTGPNMAGKSTYIRQAALIVIMAQMGCPVPARSAEIGLVDRVFTRVGAADEIARGQSTFMVEMTETANILNNATPRSFIVLDEVGRGTSTFDGVSIAWAICEFLHQNKTVAARTLFATHYHELTELADLLPRVKNFNIAVNESKDDIIFLRKIVPGGTDKSYGIHVARLAGIPGKVVERAKTILANLETQALDFQDRPKRGGQSDEELKIKEVQLTLFGSPNEHIVNQLKKLHTDELTPIQALIMLKELKDKIV